jgi:hypothetical protein
MYLQRIAIWALAVVVCLLGAACNKAAEKASEAAAERAIEAASGGEVDVDYSGDTMTVTDKETGESAEVTWEAKSMPADWPASLPQYPGSEVEAVQTHKQGDGVMMMVNLKTTDTEDAVIAFYEDKATAAGFTEAGTFSIPEGGQTIYESADQTFVVVRTIEEGALRIALTLMPRTN